MFKTVFKILSVGIPLGILSLIILISSWPVIHGTLNFHTDIARDFLLLEDVFYNRNITLIGPRSGGIPGVFHGPLWLYLNLPPYALGQGNPIFVGWFWLCLFILSMGSVFYVGSKMLNKRVGIAASLLFGSAFSISVQAFFNPQGAVFLFPFFYFLTWRYFNNFQFRYVACAFFILGCIIQFQIAFGGPIFLLIFPVILFKIVKQRKYAHILALLFLMLPLSTYILFELRHEFLQTKSIINYVSGVENSGKEQISFIHLLAKRIMGIVFDTPGLLTYGKNWLSIIIFISSFFAVLKGLRKMSFNDKDILFGYLYCGFWIMTLLYKGVMWSYYVLPFVPVLAIIFASHLFHHNKVVGYLLMIVLIGSNLIFSLKQTILHDQNYGWIFYKNIAQELFSDAPEEFGYFVYTTDQFGYPMRYAMSQIDRADLNKQSYSDQKRQVTYLLIDDPADNKYTSSANWRKYDVRIHRNPNKIFQVTKTFWVEKFILSAEEQRVASNPNLLHSIFFR